LSDFGWEQVDFDDSKCLTAGRFSLTVEDLSLRLIGLRLVLFAGMKAQTSPPKLAGWAQGPPVHGALAETRAMLEGIRFRVVFFRDAARLRAAPEKALPFQIPDGAEQSGVLEALAARHPPPDKAALREMWLKENSNWSGGRACIDIAGTSDFPADETVIDDRVNRPAFAVAIYEMLERDGLQQRVLKITVPRLELLESAGVVVSSATRGPKYRAQLPGRLYVLAPGYEQFLLRPFPFPVCLYAGQTEATVTATKYRGIEGKMIARDRYVRVEPWASSPEIREGLPDLRKAVDSGKLCMHTLILKEEGKWDWGGTGTCR